MSKPHSRTGKDDQVTKFLASMFGTTPKKFLSYGQLPDRPAEIQGDKVPRMPATMSLENEPEFWADAPWRLEPDQNDLPISIYIRDANIDSPGHAPWQLEALTVELRISNQSWRQLVRLTRPELPNLGPHGEINQGYWSHSIEIPISDIPNWSLGSYAHLRVIFTGKAQPQKETSTIEKHIEVFRAEFSLPLARASTSNGARKWFYGDTHYHSAYTNDIKEFGGPLPETRAAAKAIGLDWIVITDHSTDLDEKDSGWDGTTRWARLKTELASAEISDDQLRFILGEEITLMGKDNRLVHMLAMGALDQMIEGAFLPDESNRIDINFYKTVIENIIKLGKGYPADIPQQIFGKIHLLEDVLHMLPDDTLAFAAHPYSAAQIPPAKWDDEDLANCRLTGHEFWNARSRKKANMTNNPFGISGWRHQEILQRRDRSRIKELLNFANTKWDRHLLQGVEEWDAHMELPSRRPVFIGGTDAHGDFNYQAGLAWDYNKADQINDNALGRVRTVIYIPEYDNIKVPETVVILSALKKGSCIVTDGPVLGFFIQQAGRIAHLGESILLSDQRNPELVIFSHSTAEFGKIEHVEVISYQKGQRSKRSSKLPVNRGDQATLNLDGVQGYCRLQAQTIGAGGERFCCFTNPIWFRKVDSSAKKMYINFS